MAKCGNCVQCCVVLGVPAIDKPAGERCPMLAKPRFAKEGGCTIHAYRHDECLGFDCAWRMGFWGGVANRPDKTGVMPVIKDGEWILYMDNLEALYQPKIQRAVNHWWRKERAIMWVQVGTVRHIMALAGPFCQDCKRPLSETKGCECYGSHDD